MRRLFPQQNSTNLDDSEDITTLLADKLRFLSGSNNLKFTLGNRGIELHTFLWTELEQRRLENMVDIYSLGTVKIRAAHWKYKLDGKDSILEQAVKIHVSIRLFEYINLHDITRTEKNAAQDSQLRPLNPPSGMK